MSTHACEKCKKSFATKQSYTRHLSRKIPCTPADEKAAFTFIDLFCGIGGFHQALSELGGTCVLACDIDKDCRAVYEQNYGIKPKEDVTKLDADTIPDFDVLCAGFPCQAFSHAGHQGGFSDIRGTLFMDIVRILRAKRPKYFLLENVKNLKNHDNGNTWAVIYRNLIGAGYSTSETPILASPHYYGIPQHRDRIYILGVRNDIAPLPEFEKLTARPCSIRDILDETNQEPDLRLSTSDIEVIELWEEVVQHSKQEGYLLPTFPVWTDEWDSLRDISGDPKWKQLFVTKNREFYAAHKEFLSEWIARARNNPAFVGARRKFEWQCGKAQENDSLWTLLFQYRPSGIRVKRPTYAPALVAMAQIPVIGWLRRKMAPREVARLQSFPDTFKLSPKKTVSYKQFGNSVNVTVVKQMARHLLYSGTSAQT